ncbi:mpv17-like protein [Leptinotarsa decemlineata]|uniref:mpv17-like protein n=1 Tax=Leptinotarsa decemlineata TaxID=7539 RepID=UPI003D307FDA
MTVIFSKIVALTRHYPVVRGMISYGMIWPTSCIIQQTIAGKTLENYDWMQALRYSLYGCFITAPTLYAWIRISSVLWPGTNLKTSITKAIVEQFTYGPVALASFFFGMTLLEGKGVTEAKNAIETKMFSTWKVGACVWPVVQTINFCYIPEKNRVPFVSVCSLVWCCFLAYMHQLEIEHKELELTKSLKN